MGIHDIITIVFKHKWKILLCSIAGIAAAVGVYLSAVPMYESEAKVLVRYVVDRSSIDAIDGGGGSQRMGDAVINSEAEILTSMDIALKVAEDVGAERLVPAGKTPPTTIAAAQVIAAGMFVGARSNVIRISFKNRDPQIATLVLSKVVNEYFTKHLEVHRPTATTSFVTQQGDEVKQRLNRTEDELKKLMAKSNIISRADSSAALSAELARSIQELQAAEAELAEQSARVRELEKALTSTTGEVKSTGDSKAAPAEAAPGATIQRTDPQALRYQSLTLRVAQLRQAEFELLSKYTPENRLVKLCQSEIADIERQRAELEKEFPTIAATAPSAEPSGGRQPDVLSEKTILAGVAAKVETLKARVKEVEGKVAQFADSSLEIEQMERRKELEETNYKYIGASLEKARIDGLLDPSKMPNLSIVQSPSQAVLAMTDRDKTVFKLAGGGIALGLALAFLIELILDRSIKRPLELEAKARIPLMLTIPDLSKSAGKRLRAGRASRALEKSGRPEVLPWESGHFIRPFAEAIRDRLVLFFKLNDMTHKPKMVAVTGFSGGEGTSTVAGGLAAVLSEMGDGKVLLVDMNGGEATVHPFYEGNLVRSVSEVLQGGNSAPTGGENLVLATASVAGGGGTHMVPKKFYNMVPHFKASDFDYIIFDMPPLDKSSATLAMAGSMDKVLVVVESEKTNSDVVQRACSELVAAKARVSGILNKTRSYAPKWLLG